MIHPRVVPTSTQSDGLLAGLDDRAFGIGVEEVNLRGIHRQAYLLTHPRGALDREPRYHQGAEVVGRSRTFGPLAHHFLDTWKMGSLTLWNPEVHIFLAAHALYDLRLDLQDVQGVATRWAPSNPYVIHVFRAYPEDYLPAGVGFEALALSYHLAREWYAGTAERRGESTVRALEASPDEVHRG